MSRAATPFIPNVPRAQGSFERPERDKPLPLCTERLAFENGPRAHGKSHAERHFWSSRTRKYFCACARKVLQMRQLKLRSLTALSVLRARRERPERENPAGIGSTRPRKLPATWIACTLFCRA